MTADNASLYVRVIVSPDVLTTPEFITGPVWSSVELLVTVRAVNVTASLPTMSCTALFAVVLSTGDVAAYATVTDLAAPAGVSSVSTTVEPLTTALVTVMGTPPLVTVN